MGMALGKVLLQEWGQGRGHSSNMAPRMGQAGCSSAWLFFPQSSPLLCTRMLGNCLFYQKNLGWIQGIPLPALKVPIPPFSSLAGCVLKASKIPALLGIDLLCTLQHDGHNQEALGVAIPLADTYDQSLQMWILVRAMQGKNPCAVRDPSCSLSAF